MDPSFMVVQVDVEAGLLRVAQREGEGWGAQRLVKAFQPRGRRGRGGGSEEEGETRERRGEEESAERGGGVQRAEIRRWGGAGAGAKAEGGELKEAAWAMGEGQSEKDLLFAEERARFMKHTF
jgi:hypothetical protein